MLVVSAPMGYVLVFESKEDLETVAGHLNKQLKHIEESKVPPPYLYATFDDRIPESELQEFMQQMKYGFVAAAPEDGCRQD